MLTEIVARGGIFTFIFPRAIMRLHQSSGCSLQSSDRGNMLYLHAVNDDKRYDVATLVARRNSPRFLTDQQLAHVNFLHNRNDLCVTAPTGRSINGNINISTDNGELKPCFLIAE